jgi:hypothetical protein
MIKSSKTPINHEFPLNCLQCCLTTDRCCSMLESLIYPLDFIPEEVALSWDLGKEDPSKHVLLQVQELMEGKLLPRLKHSVIGDLAEFVNRVSQFPITKIDVSVCLRVANLTKLVLQHGEGIDDRMIESIHLLFSWNAVLREHFSIEVNHLHIKERERERERETSNVLH